MSKMAEDAKVAIQGSSKESSVYIGSDSNRFKGHDGRWKARYSTVIVLHKDSKHGCQLFHETVVMDDFGNLKQRLMTEVSFAVAAAMEIVDFLDGRHLEIHLDINPSEKHKSNVAVKEALGYVTGMGMEAKVKPWSWAATHCADHVVRHH